MLEGDVDEQVAHNDEEQEEEDTMAAYAAVDDAAPESPPSKKPVNPFSKKDRAVIASPPRKRKNVFDLLKGMGVSSRKLKSHGALLCCPLTFPRRSTPLVFLSDFPVPQQATGAQFEHGCRCQGQGEATAPHHLSEWHCALVGADEETEPTPV